jgi:hypothetical protein
LQGFAALFFAHTRQFAACTRGLAQQFRAIAQGAVRLGASGIDPKVQWHDWTLLHLPQLLFLLSSFFPE